ncbi:MAG: hypothetical protein JWQ21_3604 [Herminiimonas sp.]|nr:hypothetical protein [Herminiimonas sp.]
MQRGARIRRKRARLSLRMRHALNKAEFNDRLMMQAQQRLPILPFKPWCRFGCLSGAWAISPMQRQMLTFFFESC